MTEQINQNIEVVKYLDYNGLQKLWAKITNNFTKSEAFNSAVADLNARIDSISQSAVDPNLLVDGKTIVVEDNKLKTNLILSDDKTNHKLCIITGNDENPAVISEWDYSDLMGSGGGSMIDSVLESVNLVYIPGDEEATDGRPTGTYLKFIFNTVSGKDPIYVNVTDLVSGAAEYHGGDYIKITTVDGVPTVSLETAELVEYLKGDDVLGITSIITRLSAAETAITDLEYRLSALESKVDSIPGSNFEPITDEEINELMNTENESQE